MEFNKPERISNFLDPLIPIAVKHQYNYPVTEAEIAFQLKKRQADQAQRAMRPLKPLKERTVSASSIDKCSRQVAYEMLPDLYQPRPVETPMQRELWDAYAAHGDILHERFQKVFEAIGLVYAREFDVPVATEGYADAYTTKELKDEIKERRLVVRFDMLLKLQGLMVNGEIKTVQDKHYDPALPWFASKLKVGQAQVTMFALGLDLTLYLVVNRDWNRPLDNGRGYMLCRLERDERHIELLLLKARTITQAVERGILPAPEPGPNKRNCGLCPFRHLCPAWGN